MNSAEIVPSLTALGFTELEAEVYIFLLQESPATGYRIAQATGRRPGNIYKAIEMLQNKGAVIVDEGTNRLCRAVPATELLGLLKHQFEVRAAQAAQALADLQEAADDDRVYCLRTREQVVERFRSMLARSREIAIVDVFPDLLKEIQPDVEQAAARGVVVMVETYRPTDMPHTEVIVPPWGERVLERWPGQWLNLVIDGSEHLIAFLTANGQGVHQAIWSGSAILSLIYHSAVSGELAYAALCQQIEDDDDMGRLQEEAQRLQRVAALDNPGYRTLLARFGSRKSPKNR